MHKKLLTNNVRKQIFGVELESNWFNFIGKIIIDSKK